VPRTPSVPAYRLHKPSGQAVVTVRMPDGSRNDVYLGAHNSPESHQAYGRLIAELAVTPAPPVLGPLAAPRTVDEVLLAFWRHAQQHYRRADGTATNAQMEYKMAMKPLRELYGNTPAREFGPLALKAVRARMLGTGLARSTINDRVRRLKHLFKWAVAEELIPPATFQGLAAVGGLQKGRTVARETAPIGPVDPATVAATVPYLNRTVRAMVEVQRLAGMRPQDVCRLRPCDLDRSGVVWVYRPPQHKNAHRGKVRAVAIGPKAQAVLAKFTPADPAAHYFSPRRAVAEYRAIQRARRKSKVPPSQQNRAKKNPKKRPTERYTTESYDHAITRAVERANRAREAEKAAHGPNRPPVPEWSPNQLRHAHGTEVRKRYGLEAAQVALGHEKADVTQVYAERNLELAVKVAAEMG
jgi:integrase